MTIKIITLAEARALPGLVEALHATGFTDLEAARRAAVKGGADFIVQEDEPTVFVPIIHIAEPEL